MSVLIDLVRDLSWSLKAAWMAWGLWVAVQIVWHRRARAVPPPASRDSVSRAPLGIGARPERVRVSAAPPVSLLSPVPPSMPEPSAQPIVEASTFVDAIVEVVEPIAAQPPQSAAAKRSEPPAPSKRQKRRRSSRGAETPSVMSAEAV